MYINDDRLIMQTKACLEYLIYLDLVLVLPIQYYVRVVCQLVFSPGLKHNPGDLEAEIHLTLFKSHWLNEQELNWPLKM